MFGIFVPWIIFCVIFWITLSLRECVCLSRFVFQDSVHISQENRQNVRFYSIYGNYYRQLSKPVAVKHEPIVSFNRQANSIRNILKRTFLLQSTDEKPNIQRGTTAANFLSNIMEYGKNRMARRAVGILQKMPAYQVYPTTDHYEAALWACENSDQFLLAMSVYTEMKELEIPFTIKCYESLIAVAEKTSHLNEVIQLFNEMRLSGIKGTTITFNSYLWACVKARDYEAASELLSIMEEEAVAIDSHSYTAVIMACESAGNGPMALKVFNKVMDRQQSHKNDIDTLTINAVMWACVKSRMFDEAMTLFDSIPDLNLKRDAGSYTAAIWACEGIHDYEKAIELLRLMKFEGHSRTIEAFDGVISTLRNCGQWESLHQVLRWIDQDELTKTSFTYCTAIEAFDKADRSDLCMEQYIRALRDNLISPWFKGTRIVNLMGVNVSVAKVILTDILNLMKDKKLPPFPLVMVMCAKDEDSTKVDDDGEYYENMARTLDEFVKTLEPRDILDIEGFEEDNQYKLRISLDLLKQWIGR